MRPLALLQKLRPLGLRPTAREAVLLRRRSAGLRFAALALALLSATPARAFWLLGFSTAATQTPGTAGFIGGTGGQLTVVQDKASFTPYLAHAGLRLGILDDLDVGYRLCTVALPYNAGGPVLGGQLDVKLRLTALTSRWAFAVGASGANAFLQFAGATSTAWSPGAYAILSHPLSRRIDWALDARYVRSYVEPSGNAPAGLLDAVGGSAGLKIDLLPHVAVRPELGLFDFMGTIHGEAANGWGLQYGAVLSAQAW